MYNESYQIVKLYFAKKSIFMVHILRHIYHLIGKDDFSIYLIVCKNRIFIPETEVLRQAASKYIPQKQVTMPELNSQSKTSLHFYFTNTILLNNVFGNVWCCICVCTVTLLFLYILKLLFF